MARPTATSVDLTGPQLPSPPSSQQLLLLVIRVLLVPLVLMLVPSSQAFPVTSRGSEPCVLTGEAGNHLQCDTSHYWSRPCAGCREATQQVVTFHDWTPAPPQPKRLLQELRKLETLLHGYLNDSMEAGRWTMFMNAEEFCISLAAKYNIQTQYKCTEGQNIYVWMKTQLANLAPFIEEIYDAENIQLLTTSGSLDCWISRAINSTRKTISDTLCQLSIQLPVSETGSEGDATSGPNEESHVLNYAGANQLDRYDRDHVIVLYALKSIRKMKRLLRREIRCLA